jgi:histidine triad (HIT) family protein
LQNTVKSYKIWLWATGINILNANGKDAQQSVPHLHFHLIPRFPDDHLDLRPDFPNYDWKFEEVLAKIKRKCLFIEK